MSFFWKRAKALAQFGCAFSLLSLVSGVASAQQIAATSGTLSAAQKSNFASQFRAFQNEKAALTPAQRKLSTSIALSIPAKKARVTRGFSAFQGFLNTNADGRSDLIITGQVTPALMAAISRFGGEVVTVMPSKTAVRVLITAAGAERVAGLAEVKFIKPYLDPLTRVGPKTTEGDVALSAATTRDLFKISGKGIKVGVISDGVKNLSKSQASGELPDKVSVIKNGQGKLQTGSGDEGTAMLEIVHDIAPDAQLFFATGNGGEEVMADNVKRLRKAGCDIIVDDLLYYAEGVYQDGPIANAVTEVVNDGALYFSAVGNDGNLRAGTSGTWDGQFKAGTQLSTTKGIATVQLWEGQESNPVIDANGYALAMLQWADPLGKSTNDYDLYVLDEAGDIVFASQDVQAGDSDAIELTLCQAGNRIVVTRQNGAARPVHLQLFGGILGVATEGAGYSHSSSAKAISVAAVSARVFEGGNIRPFEKTDVVENFSSDGYRTYYFDASGKKKTYTVKAPQIASADGVTTSVGGFERFYGTSAAAPHAAATAALIWSYNLKQSAEQVKKTLYSTALDIMASGYDRNSGYGIVTADRALASIGQAVLSISPNPIVVKEGNSGTKTFKVTVSLSKASDSDVTLQYATKSDTAKGGSDFQSKSGTVTIPKGSKSASLTFTINGDTTFEADETFKINFDDIKLPLKGKPSVDVTITNDDNAAAAVSTGPSGSKS